MRALNNFISATRVLHNTYRTQLQHQTGAYVVNFRQSSPLRLCAETWLRQRSLNHPGILPLQQHTAIDFDPSYIHHQDIDILQC